MSSLSPYEIQRFKSLSAVEPEDVLSQVKKLDDNHAAESLVRRCTQYITPFLKIITQYNGLVSSFIQYAPAPTSVVWGGVVSVAQLMIQHTAYFDKIAELFEEIGQILRPISQYAESIYKDDLMIQDALADLYGDILRFVRVATSVFLDKKGKSRSGLQSFAIQLWRPFESQFEDLKTQFRNHLRQAELEMTVADHRITRDEAVQQGKFRSTTALRMQEFSILREENRKAAAEAKRRDALAWPCPLSLKAVRNGCGGHAMLKPGHGFCKLLPFRIGWVPGIPPCRVVLEKQVQVNLYWLLSSLKPFAHIPEIGDLPLRLSTVIPDNRITMMRHCSSAACSNRSVRKRRASRPGS